MLQVVDTSSWGVLLGLNGAAGSGKDTVAEYLVAKHKFKRYAFADAVRDVALAIDPMVDPMDNHLSVYVEKLGWDRAKRELVEIRRLLQVIGTEAGRLVLGENVWVDILKKKWEADEHPDAVITDFRFANEHLFIQASGGKTVKIIRPDNPTAIGNQHVSEQYAPLCDYALINDSSLAQLHTSIDSIITHLHDTRLIKLHRTKGI